MRRLNRVEYAISVRDLFSLDDNFASRIEKELPADGKVGGFDRGAASLFMDEGQLDQYMTVADIVLNDGVFHEQPQVQKLTYDGTAERYVHGLMTAYKNESGAFIESNVPSVVANLKEPLSWIPQPNFDQWGSKDRHVAGSTKRRGDARRCQFAGVRCQRPVTQWDLIPVGAGIQSGAVGREAPLRERLLLCYALGRPIGYADHPTVEQITAHAATHDDRLQEIIQATVACELFQTE